MSSEFIESMLIRTMKYLATAVFLLGSAVCIFGQADDVLPIVFDPDGQARITYWAHAVGDDAAWAAKDFDHSGWEIIHSPTVRTDSLGVHWFRARFRIAEPPDSVRLFVCRILRLPSAYEVYWDGRLLGTNGTVGKTKSEEIPGRTHFPVRVDDEGASAGEHVIALRVSNFHARRRFTRFWAELSYEDVPHLQRSGELFWEVFYIGIFFTGVILGLTLFLGGGRYRPYLYFSMICLATLIFSTLHFVLNFFNLSTLMIPVFAVLRAQLYILIEIMLIVFFLFNFDIPKKWIHIAAITSVLIITRPLGLNDALGFQLHLWFVVLHPLGLLGYSVLRRKAGSIIALGGFLVFIIPEMVGLFGVPTSNFLNMITYVVFLLALILSISRQIGEQNRMQRMIERRSSRLEADLLKKSIQPHFLMNTLHAIQAWAKRNPENVSKLIQAFADEMRILTHISAKKEIPLRQEIDLCRAHLQLMGYRRIAVYRLETENLCEEATVPPLIFHTLVENGLTHAYRPTENGVFRLSCEREDGHVTYRLRNDGSMLEGLASRTHEDVEEGMGFRYVRARLEERYPGRWRMDYGLVDGWWEVRISIRV